MKMFIVYVLSFALALSMVACGGYTAKGIAASRDDGTTGKSLQISNPWQECDSLAEAGKLAGFSFTAPESVDGYTEKYIAAIENAIAQVIFSNEDGAKLYFRKGLGSDDISGDYNTYDVTGEQTIDGKRVLCKGNDGLVYTATWTDGNYAYAVMSDTGMDAEQLSAWVQSLA